MTTKDSIQLTVRDMFSGKLSQMPYKEPEITGIRGNKRELVLSVDSAGQAGGGDYLAILNQKCGITL